MRKISLLLLLAVCLFSACHRRDVMRVADDGCALTLSCDGSPILTYQYAVAPAPEGARPIFARGGYIHPACTPSGFVLTRIQPPDHFHHYGIWNPWTHVIYDGRLYDLWNLGDSLGTVRPREIEAVYEGKGFCGFDASLDHVAFTPEGETVILDEQWRIRATRVPEGYLWDFESRLRPVTGKPVTIQAYRYQGFGIRANERWGRDNCTMMTSEGLERPQIDGSRARWLYMVGETGPSSSAGFLIMSHPGNRQAPEPVRIWNEDANGGKENVFVNFCPAKFEDWVLEPGNEYTLRYRFLAFDGGIDATVAERLWKQFAETENLIGK